MKLFRKILSLLLCIPLLFFILLAISYVRDRDIFAAILMLGITLIISLILYYLWPQEDQTKLDDISTSNKQIDSIPINELNMSTTSSGIPSSRTNSKIEPKSNIKPTKNKYTIKEYFEKDITVIDFETTGLNSYYDEIIQIGAIKYRNGEVVNTFDHLVKPSVSISEKITSITGITNEMVKGAPPIHMLIHDLVDFIGKDTLVAHNASFDMGFLIAALNNNGINLGEIKVIDTLRLSRSMIHDTKNHKLVTLKKYLGIKAQSHNALEDCIVTGELYYYLKREKDKEPGMYDGKHYTNYVEEIRELKREGKNEEAIDLLLHLIDVIEEEAKIEECGPAPWYYEQLAILYRKTKQPQLEHDILRRYIDFCEEYGAPNGATHGKLLQRYEKLGK